MAEFDFVVDTTPMAETVSSVSNHVTANTAAVVAMQTAVIASEKASAKKICNNVDAGFHGLIRSQLSMKISVAYTEMQAKLALLLEYSKTLRKTRDRMESDFNRVKRQYSQIFKGLDKALANRISQLDKNIIFKQVFTIKDIKAYAVFCLLGKIVGEGQAKHIRILCQRALL